MFRDKVNFSREFIINIRVEKNRHALAKVHHQQELLLNVWTGILGDHLIGPQFLLPKFNGDPYTHFLEEVLSVFLEDLPVGVRAQLCLCIMGLLPILE